MSSINNTELLALSKSVKDAVTKATSEATSPGVYPVDFTVRISGTVQKGEDTFKVPTSRTPTLAAMALLIQRLGVQRERAVELLMSCVKDAIELGDDAEDQLMENTGVREMEARLRAEFAKLPPTKVNGAVKALLKVEKL